MTRPLLSTESPLLGAQANTVNRKKRLLLFAMPAAVLGIGAGGVAFTVMAVKDQTYVPSAPYLPEGEPNHCPGVRQ